MAEDAAELVVVDLADEGAAAAERGHPGDGIGGRAAGELHGRAHGPVEVAGAIGIDQRHGALRQPMGGQEGIVGMAEDIDDGIADADDVEDLVGHAAIRPACRAAQAVSPSAAEYSQQRSRYKPRLSGLAPTLAQGHMNQSPAVNDSPIVRRPHQGLHPAR